MSRTTAWTTKHKYRTLVDKCGTIQARFLTLKEEDATVFHKKRPISTPASYRLPPADRLRLEADFLERVYDALDRTRDVGGVVERELNIKNRDHPHWWWVLHGTRERWCLEIHDNRIPELVGKPYYLDPVGDPSFFDSFWSQEPIDLDPQIPEENYFIGNISTAMDESLLGQAEALRAYKSGATPDNPPWVHTIESA